MIAGSGVSIGFLQEDPATSFATAFFGSANRLNAEVSAEEAAS